MTRRRTAGLACVLGVALVASLALLPGQWLDLGQGQAHAQPQPQPQVQAQAKKADPKEIEHYQQKVLPLLKQHCYKCHGDGKAKGGLDLTNRKAILQGGDLGPAVNLEKIDESNLLLAIHYRDGLEMPPSGKLPDQDIAIIERWVRAGVPFPEETGEVKPRPKGKEKEQAGKVTPEARNHWAYQPVRPVPPPEVQNRQWVRNPIDAFILAKLESKGLTPAAPADRVALIRRVYYDLIGLPPTPEEVDAFVQDQRPDAYEQLIERLLASPHYGERWARHWLDLVRYAESNGYERDGHKPFPWRYRDYVIRSFNQDKGYDQFIREQLAGDEMPFDADAIIATGYYRLGLWDDEPADYKQSLADEFDDIVTTTSQVFLAMTLNCARCHDHKIDPIPQTDYYRFLAFFADIERYSKTRDVRSPFNLTDITPLPLQAKYRQELDQRHAKIKELVGQMRVIEDAAIKKMPAKDQRATEGPEREKVLEAKLKDFLTVDEAQRYGQLKSEADRLKKLPEPPRELALSVNQCMVNPPPTHVHIRGNPHALGAKVTPGFPAVLGFADPVIPPPGPQAKSSGRRTVLANWIASPQNPLTARVMVNRIWQHHFGRGLVASSSDFGKYGTTPTHPELLDWLADQFVREGWKLKAMHRLIMTSNTYRMSSRANAEALKVDPENTHYWRFNMRRLSAEEIRDSMLAVSGLLNKKMYGPSVFPKLPREVLATASNPNAAWGHSPPDEANRRSIYVFVKRSLQVPLLATHDQADTDSSCPVRYTTTVPTQALGMLNGEFTREQAQALARRLTREVPNDLTGQVRLAIRLTAGRLPTEAEVRDDLALIADLRQRFGASPQVALEQYCLMMLNTNEFVYLD
jgi:mono/diheme cytochrome c family protein